MHTSVFERIKLSVSWHVWHFTERKKNKGREGKFNDFSVKEVRRKHFNPSNT